MHKNLLRALCLMLAVLLLSTGCTSDRISGDIPEVLEALKTRNPETADFVNNYPGSVPENVELCVQPPEIPALYQWDARWGYTPYGGSRPEDLVGVSGCGPTALSMVILGLTGDTAWHPGKVAAWAAENGYSTKNSGTSWTLISEGSSHFGLRATELPLWKDTVLNALRDDKPVILVVGPGDFTETGHYLVLTKVDENGQISLNDPFSMANTAKSWAWERLEGQIRCLWSLEKQ